MYIGDVRCIPKNLIFIIYSYINILTQIIKVFFTYSQKTYLIIIIYKFKENSFSMLIFSIGFLNIITKNSPFCKSYFEAVSILNVNILKYIFL